MGESENTSVLKAGRQFALRIRKVMQVGISVRRLGRQRRLVGNSFSTQELMPSGSAESTLSGGLHSVPPATLGILVDTNIKGSHTQEAGKCE